MTPLNKMYFSDYQEKYFQYLCQKAKVIHIIHMIKINIHFYYREM